MLSAVKGEYEKMLLNIQYAATQLVALWIKMWITYGSYD